MPAAAQQEIRGTPGIRPALRPVRADDPAAAVFPKAQLRRALQERRLRVAYQPVVRLADARVVGREALARVLTPAGRLLPAEAFLDAAAEMAFEPHVDRDISDRVMAAARSEPEPVTAERGKLFINCSSAFLTDPDCVRHLADRHHRWAAARSWSCDEEAPWVLEITERNLDICPSRLHIAVAPLLELGFQLALDDFGSTHSAFPHLLQTPIRYLKIDKGPVQAAVTDARAELTLRRMADLAQGLGMIAIAEGIETPPMLDRALAAGIAWGQGYFLGRPSVETPH